MNASSLDLFQCPDCESTALSGEWYDVAGDDVVEGKVTCGACAQWFRIEERVLDLLPRQLRRHELYAAFAKRHGLDYCAPEVDPSDADKVAQLEFFKKDADAYDEAVVDHPYYKALDELTVRAWMRECLAPGRHLLDVGCGTGKQSVHAATEGLQVVGIDLAEEMLRVGMRKAIESGVAVQFVVADAEHPPVRDERFDGCLFHGVLHHLPNPRTAIASAAKKLRPGGHLHTLDPHKSPLRFVFDWLMRIWKLYDEEASDDPLLRTEDLLGWTRQAGIDARVILTTYLPPHVFLIDAPRLNAAVLRVSDAVFRAIPGLRKCAGAIAARGVRR